MAEKRKWWSLDKGCFSTWWRHQMETFSALLAICVGNSPVTGEFPTQRPVTLSFDVFFDLCLNKCLSKQSWGWWFEMSSCPLWRHCNDQPGPRDVKCTLYSQAGYSIYGLLPWFLDQITGGYGCIWGLRRISATAILLVIVLLCTPGAPSINMV